MRPHLPLLALLALGLPPGPVAAAAPADGATGEWRGARWGMNVKEVLDAFPGEATRLDPEQRLADGNTVSAGIERHELGGQAFRVRFVFEGGRLALVSLVAGHEKFAGPEDFESLRKLLAGQFGEPGTATQDDAFIDMRQVRWERPRGRVDLKFIPGKVVILHSRPQAAAGKAGS